jgi:glycosyltransferase involved in cell wall biosynthesis
VGKKVTHLSFSSSGGAGTVASRLSNAQKKLGWDARLLTSIAKDLRREPLKHPLHTATAGIDHYVVKKPGFDSLFSLTRDRVAGLKFFPGPGEIVHFHWVTGLLDFQTLPQPFDNRVFWTLHDMNPFTGGCHYSLGCEGFTRDCSGCPAVRKTFESQVKKNLGQKRALYETWANLVVVAPNNWMARQASLSSALKNLPISIIRYPLDPQFFHNSPAQSNSRSPRASKIFTLAIVAAQLDSPLKDVKWALDVFLNAKNINTSLRMILIGHGGRAYRDVPGIELKGPLTPPELVCAFDQVDALIIPSIADNSPSVAFEAASRGVLPIVRKNGGLPEIVEILGDGFVVESQRELEALLLDQSGVLSNPPVRRRALAKKAHDLTEPSAVAQQYIDLYESME